MYKITISAVCFVLLVFACCNSDQSTSENSLAQTSESTTGENETTKAAYTIDNSEFELGKSPIGQMAPDFTISDMDGQKLALSDYRGNHVVLIFVATWCPFCSRQAPFVEQVFQDFKDKGVKVLMVDVSEPTSVIMKLKEKYDLSVPILLDKEGSAAAKYFHDVPAKGNLAAAVNSTEIIASTWIIDPKGIVRYCDLLDTKSPDAELIALQNKLNELLVEN